jgi:hypothetical protein
MWPIILRSAHEDGSPLMATADRLLPIGIESVAAAGVHSFFSRKNEVKSESCCSTLACS